MMDEKAKAKAGYLYDGNYEPSMAAERLHAKGLCHKFNQLPPSRVETDGRALLDQLFARLGGDAAILQPFYCDYGYNIEIGDNFFSNHMLVILDAARVTFGHHVFIGPNCGFYTAGHALDVEKRNRGLEIAWPITVGDNVWFGGNVVVLPGVKIGSGSIIGAGSVVTKSIPPGVIAVGNPCRVARAITPEDASRYPVPAS